MIFAKIKLTTLRTVYYYKKYIYKNAYELNLFKNLKIYNVFHVSFLREYKFRKKKFIPEPEFFRLAVNSKFKKYKIQNILNREFIMTRKRKHCNIE